MMTKDEILAELLRFSPTERREIARLIFEIDEDTATIAECDRLADERFQLLDRLEDEDAKAQSR